MLRMRPVAACPQLPAAQFLADEFQRPLPHDSASSQPRVRSSTTSAWRPAPPSHRWDRQALIHVDDHHNRSIFDHIDTAMEHSTPLDPTEHGSARVMMSAFISRP